MNFSVIIVAAGQGKRLGADMPKQFIKIAGKTILEHTIDAFKNMEGLENMCVVTQNSHELKDVIICTGGKERKDSVYNGLKKLSHLKNKDMVLIHDAARPFVKQQDIKNLLEAMQTNEAATLAKPITDTLRYESQKNMSRDKLWAMQTPQAFHYGLIREAHEKADPNQEHTDDTSLVAALGYDVKFVESGSHNFKITTSQDLAMAQEILETYETRSGMGFDVHAFDETPAQNIRLCGIDIPHNRKLKGHSDADVGLHTLTDAILGAIGAGDIGVHFPPSDNTFKNMDSAIFLEHAMTLLHDKGGELINADLTIICEEPKIGKHRDAILKRLSEILKTPQSRLNIKATTTERLGFTGRAEGIAAQATVSISLPRKLDG